MCVANIVYIIESEAFMLKKNVIVCMCYLAVPYDHIFHMRIHEILISRGPGENAAVLCLLWDRDTFCGMGDVHWDVSLGETAAFCREMSPGLVQG